MSMFAGIDWGGHRHQLAVVDPSGMVLVNRPFAHDRAGVEELLAELASHADHPIPVAIERSGGIVVEALQRRGDPVYPLSPRTP